MAKQAKHEHSIGDIVTFKFFDGGNYSGKITHHTYQGDNVESLKTRYDMPTYKIRVENPKGFTIYPCITDQRIVNKDKTALQVSKEFISRPDYKIAKPSKAAKGTKEELALDAAIKAQKDFLNK
tara:strand:- start:426 stop:797 length:372 start_codon:yes stop_codon:yes gene_type:complete